MGKKKTAKKAVKPAPTFVEKQINGAKNGGKRMVRVKRLRNDVPTMDKAPKGTSTKFFSKQKRTLRPSLASGTVAISCWSSQGKTCYCPQTVGIRTRPCHRTLEIERLSHEKNQPTLPFGYQD